MLLPHMVCNALVAGGRRSAGYASGMREAARAASLIPVFISMHRKHWVALCKELELEKATNCS